MRLFVHFAKFKTVVLCIVLVFTTVMLSSCQTGYPEYTGFAMGSVLTARLYNMNNETADALWQEISDAVAKADSLLSASNPDSDIAVLNRMGSVNADSFTVQVVSEAITDGNLTGGCMDISLGSVTSLWGFNTDSPHCPTSAQITYGLQFCGLNNILVSEEIDRISVSANTRLDLGAVGKGAGCKAAYDVLKTQSSPAVLSLGGTVLLYGKNPKGDAWSVGVRNPFGEANDYFALLSLTPDNSTNSLYISTSGSYEKQFTENGVTYHHILNPVTGYPVKTTLISVTVVSQGGVMSDALSTACFVNGFNSVTLSWLQNFSAEAVFVFENGDYYVTDGLKDCFTLSQKDGFTEIADGTLG